MSSTANAILIICYVIYLVILISAADLDKDDAKCTKNDQRQLYPTCMLASADKTLWCDQSNYTRIPATEQVTEYIPEGNASLAMALNVNDSCLQMIDKDDLSGYAMIKTLHLENNLLRELAASAFIHNSELQSIDLHSNQIERIEIRAFQGLAKLQHLNLNDNKLSEMPHFHGLNSLQTLTIDSNSISVILRQHLNRLASLKQLSIRGNRISHIADMSFSRMKSLTHLHLDWNKIEKLSDKTFHGLPSLEVLTLSYNNLYDWPERYGELFASIQILDLGNNQIRAFTSRHLEKMTALEVLSLANNSLRIIPEDLFQSTQRLTFINMSGNYIEDIPKLTFNGLCRLKTLLLHNNHLKTPRAEWFQNIINGNYDVRVEENRWNCDCNAVAFQEFMDEPKAAEARSRIKVTCFSPKFASGHILDNILAEDIKYRSKCPENKPPTAVFQPCSAAPSSGSKALTTHTTPKVTTESIKKDGGVTNIERYIPATPRSLAQASNDIPEPYEHSFTEYDDASKAMKGLGTRTAVLIVVFIVFLLAAIALISYFVWRRISAQSHKSPYEKAVKQSKRKRNDSSERCLEDEATSVPVNARNDLYEVHICENHTGAETCQTPETCSQQSINQPPRPRCPLPTPPPGTTKIQKGLLESAPPQPTSPSPSLSRASSESDGLMIGCDVADSFELSLSFWDENWSALSTRQSGDGASITAPKALL